MQAVLDFLKENESRFIGELFDYVRFPSVSAQPQHRDDLKACAEWLVARCRQIGLQTRLCPTDGHPIVLAKTPPVSDASPRRPHFLVYAITMSSHRNRLSSGTRRLSNHGSRAIPCLPGAPATTKARTWPT